MPGPLRGKNLGDTGEIKNGAAALGGGKILDTGTTEEILKRHPEVSNRIDACGKLVIPGFVDSHTHTVYAGNRTQEFGLRLKGATYLEILASGGGILSTVKATREASEEELYRLSKERLSLMMAHGTTTVEIKSGYGLDFETEKKMLRTARRLKETEPCKIVTTYLGAHTLPKDLEREEYLDLILQKALPELKDLSDFCDVFCEKGAFTYEESERILKKAKDLGYGLKIHAGQFSELGSAGMAARLGAVSADHLERIGDRELADMAASGTVAVLLPGASFFLLKEDYPPARRIISAGVPVALATDLNPGSSPCLSMQMAITLAVLKLGMTAEEALAAATINAAYACGLGETTGSLEPGKDADLLILSVNSPWEIPYYFGSNLVKTVICSGRVI